MKPFLCSPQNKSQSHLLSNPPVLTWLLLTYIFYLILTTTLWSKNYHSFMSVLSFSWKLKHLKMYKKTGAVVRSRGFPAPNEKPFGIIHCHSSSKQEKQDGKSGLLLIAAPVFLYIFRCFNFQLKLKHSYVLFYFITCPFN